jgi:hypothetical protein
MDENRKWTRSRRFPMKSDWKKKIGGHASSFGFWSWMQFSTNFRPPKTAIGRQKIDKNRRKLSKIIEKCIKITKKWKFLQKINKIAKKHEKNVIFAKNQ